MMAEPAIVPRSRLILTLAFAGILYPWTDIWAGPAFERLQSLAPVNGNLVQLTVPAPRMTPTGIQDVRAGVIRDIISQISCQGCPPTVHAETARILEQVLLQANPRVVSAMRSLSTFLVPWDQLLIEHVRKTFRTIFSGSEQKEILAWMEHSYTGRLLETGDRTPAEPRGFALSSPRALLFLGEENLTSSGLWDKRLQRSRRIIIHELGHVVYDLAIDACTRKRLDQEYAQRLAAAGVKDGPGASEFFAETMEVWFGVHQLKSGVEGRNATFIQQRQPPLYDLFLTVMGPPRSVAP